MKQIHNHGEMTMKKQTGLTIIKLMVLLLIAGIAGSLLINAVIRQRCLTETSAHMCIEKSSLERGETSGAPIKH